MSDGFVCWVCGTRRSYGVALQINAVLKVIGLTAFSKADALLKTKYNNPKDIILFIGWKTTENRVP